MNLESGKTYENNCGDIFNRIKKYVKINFMRGDGEEFYGWKDERAKGWKQSLKSLSPFRLQVKIIIY